MGYQAARQEKVAVLIAGSIEFSVSSSRVIISHIMSRASQSGGFLFFLCVCVKDQARFRKGFAWPVTLCLFPFTIKLEKDPYIHQWKCLQSPGWVTVSWTDWGSNGLSGAPPGDLSSQPTPCPWGTWGATICRSPGPRELLPQRGGAQGYTSASPRARS